MVNILFYYVCKNLNSLWITRAVSSETRRKAFVMLEVLMAMTILSIAGTVLMRSLLNSVEASKVVRDTTKAIYLTQGKLHEFELKYSGKAEPPLGEFRGTYTEPGASKFQWKAYVELDRMREAYVITVSTTWGDEGGGARYRRSRRNQESEQFMLKSMVWRARYNEDLVFGIQPRTREANASRNTQRKGRR
ncbi:MAG: type II secretion system protein [Candidatus Omnitrophota bacterium]